MLYRQIHLFIGDVFHVLPCTHYQAILLSIKFLFLQAYFLHISLKAHIILKPCTNEVFGREYINQISKVAKTFRSYLIQAYHAILKDFL